MCVLQRTYKHCCSQFRNSQSSPSISKEKCHYKHYKNQSHLIGLAWIGLELELLNHHDSGHFKFTSQISTAGDFQIIYLYRLLANYIKFERSSIERAFLRSLYFSTKIKLCIYCWIACRSVCRL